MSAASPVIDRDPTAALLAKLEARCFPDPWEEPLLARLLTNPHVGAWSLREPDGRVCGLLLFQRLGDEAEVLRIGLDPARRRRGWGRLLLHRFLADCERTGVVRIVLEARPSNEPALRLYQALGFTAIGRRRGYYRDPPEDSLVFERRLKPARADARPAPSVPR